MFLYLKKIARNNIIQDKLDLEEFLSYLKGWWARKYNRPKQDPILLSMYYEELIIEYFEDLFLKDKVELARFEKEIGVGEYLEYDEWIKKQEESNEISPLQNPTQEFEDTY